MAQAAQPDQVEIQSISFEPEHFELAADGRLELRGRWFGVRGRRFVRPTLTLIGNGERTRLLADLEHKPWAAEDGELWRAAFTLAAPPVGVVEAELAVAPDIAVSLQPPQKLSSARATARPRRARPSGAAVAASRAAPAAQEPQGRLDVGGREREAARRERDEAIRERDEARKGWRDAHAGWRKATRERDRARAERDHVLAERDRALAERDRARAERDRALAGRDRALAERDTALRAREELAELRKLSEAEAAAAAVAAPQPAGGALFASPAPVSARKRNPVYDFHPRRMRPHPRGQTSPTVAWVTRVSALVLLLAAIAVLFIIVHSA